MKKIIYLLIILSNTISFGQLKDLIRLSSLKENVYSGIKIQGFKLFCKSSCYNKSENYYIFPDFNVEAMIALDSLRFDNPKDLLNNLSFHRTSKRKFLNDVSWEAVNSKNTMFISSSDSKRFYCYTSSTHALGYILKANDMIGLKNIKYFFYIRGTDGFIRFIVDYNERIYVFHTKLDKWFNLSEFNKFYESGKIKHFSDNPFDG